jgi:hypothetical protein
MWKIRSSIHKNTPLKFFFSSSNEEIELRVAGGSYYFLMEKEIEFTKHAPQYRVKIKFSNICIVEGAESVQSVKIWTPPTR